MSAQRRAIAGALLALVAVCAGCPRPCPTQIVSHEQLVATHNDNAAAVPRLWARARTTVWPGEGPPMGWSFTGNLLLAKGENPLGPHDFVLIGREAGVEVFRMGTSLSDELYYFWMLLGERAGGAYGRLEYAGAPGIQGLDVDPLQLLSVLGVTALPQRAGNLPAVGMTLSRDPCAYVLTYVDRQPVTGRVLFRRQVYLRWDDRQEPRPFRVVFLDENGRELMTATLEDYRPIEISPALREEGVAAAMMPTTITIEPGEPPLLPGEQRPAPLIRRLRIELSDMVAEVDDDFESRWERIATDFWDRLPATLRRDVLVPVDAHIQPYGDRRP